MCAEYPSRPWESDSNKILIPAAMDLKVWECLNREKQFFRKYSVGEVYSMQGGVIKMMENKEIIGRNTVNEEDEECCHFL